MEFPWLVGGDFNVIVSEEVKYGGMLAYIHEVEDFAHCNNICNLFDLGYKGSLYTWWNGRSGDDFIFKRLDRCLGNLKFLELFPALEVIKEHYQSDVEGNLFVVFHHKLSNVKKALVGWSKETFGDIFKQIVTLEDVIKVHEIEFELNPTPQNRAKLHKVEADLTRYLHLAEESWRQKAGMQ
nr:uncharacterized protein LOC104116818 [Nicotiana tomentosiformis]